MADHIKKKRLKTGLDILLGTEKDVVTKSNYEKNEIGLALNISDIKANKDFQIMPTAKYINLQDMRTHNITSFNVRYKRLMNLAHINIAKDIK